MKTMEWRKYLEEQARQHKKFLFSITELANISGTSRRAVNVELSRLRRYGLIERYGRGYYGLPAQVTLEILLPFLDHDAYITGNASLFHHGLITQLPAVATCFTSRRHSRSEFSTPTGRFAFVCVKAPVYRRPDNGIMVGPEQALCDYVYLMRRRGVAPESQVTFCNLRRLRIEILKTLDSNYPRTVMKQINHLLEPLNNSRNI